MSDGQSLSPADLVYYLSHCSGCGGMLNSEARRNGRCQSCSFVFSAEQRRHAKANSECYGQMVRLVNGGISTVIERADKLVDRKIHEVHGILAVTSHGIECLDWYFSIHHSALRERDWLAYLSGKRWLNKKDLAKVMNRAKQLHPLRLGYSA